MPSHDQSMPFSAGFAASPALRHEIEQYYFGEAVLLDGREYRTWFALLADDIRYRMPLRFNPSVYPSPSFLAVGHLRSRRRPSQRP